VVEDREIAEELRLPERREHVTGLSDLDPSAHDHEEVLTTIAAVEDLLCIVERDLLEHGRDAHEILTGKGREQRHAAQKADALEARNHRFVLGMERRVASSVLGPEGRRSHAPQVQIARRDDAVDHVGRVGLVEQARAVPDRETLLEREVLEEADERLSKRAAVRVVERMFDRVLEQLGHLRVALGRGRAPRSLDRFDHRRSTSTGLGLEEERQEHQDICAARVQP